jgi:hypothetical protein
VVMSSGWAWSAAPDIAAAQTSAAALVPFHQLSEANNFIGW